VPPVKSRADAKAPDRRVGQGRARPGSVSRHNPEDTDQGAAIAVDAKQVSQAHWEAVMAGLAAGTKVLRAPKG